MFRSIGLVGKWCFFTKLHQKPILFSLSKITFSTSMHFNKHVRSSANIIQLIISLFDGGEYATMGWYLASWCEKQMNTKVNNTHNIIRTSPT